MNLYFFASESEKITFSYINPSRPNSGRREKINLNFYFLPYLCYLKKTLKVFIKPFEAPQRSVKIKINFLNAQDEKG